MTLRRFPYPFRAAVALSNDADQLDHAAFRRLHRFLATGETTEWGPGLSLDVGGSFFMFSSPGSPNTLTVFDGLGDSVTPEGEYLLDCARRGILDTLHTYGCFLDAADFDRSLAELALETLSSRGITIETWINHGASSNVQCLGRRPGWGGDQVGMPAYHADLTLAYGFRWIWTGETTEQIALRPDRLVEPYVLRDGGATRRFRRFSGVGVRTPVLDDLPIQLSPANLDRLARQGGYAIVYQHLAVRRRRPGFGAGAYGPVDEAWFRPAELDALRDLASRHHRGELWVIPTSSLLRYRDIWHGVRWWTERGDDGDTIVIDGEGARGWRGPVSAQDLGGLTFYCDRPEDARVLLARGGSREDALPVRVNPADETGRRSVTVGDERRHGRPL